MSYLGLHAMITCTVLPNTKTLDLAVKPKEGSGLIYPITTPRIEPNENDIVAKKGRRAGKWGPS